MRQRTLGQDGLQVSALGFGCMGISFGYGPATSRDEGLAIIELDVSAKGAERSARESVGFVRGKLGLDLEPAGAAR